MSDELEHIKKLAGIKSNEDIVLIPQKILSHVEETAELLEKIKKLDGTIGENWTKITINGIDYIATGVERDLK